MAESRTTPKVLNIPMPTPGTSQAPYFKGKRVSDFLESLEAHALAAQIPLDQLPTYVLRYCDSKVKRVIETNDEFSGTDWKAVKTLLVDLYGSSDKAPVLTADKLRAWIKRHAEEASITSLRDVDKYYRQFLAFSAPLTRDKMLLDYEANLLFYRGIPKPLREVIKTKIAPEKQKVKAAPSVKETLAFLRQEFDEEDIDAEIETTDLNLSSDDSDSDDSDSDDDQYKKKKKTKRDKKKKDKGRATKVVVDEDKETTTAGSNPAIEELTRQMKDLMINQANFQQQIASQLTSSNERRCFLCDKTGAHRLGITNCPELQALIGEGFIKYNEQGKIVKKDGSPLPRAMSGSGGIAKMLRDERMADRGKMKETNAVASGSSYTNHVELLYEGRSVLSEQRTELAFSNNNAAYPVTRSQQNRKDARMDPLKRGAQKDKAPEIPPVPDRRQANNLPPQKPPVTQDVQMKDPPPQSRPHPSNTEQGWKDHAKARKDNVPKQNDEANKTKGNGFYFSSNVQDSINSDEVQERILNTEVTLTLKEVLGVSSDLQKRFGNLVKTKRVEKQVKNSLILQDYQYDEDRERMARVSETVWINPDEATDIPDVSDAPFVSANTQLSFDSSNDVILNVATHYANSAVPVDIPNTLAFTTGRFEARMAGHKVTFMIDTGSELNLISEAFYRRTSLPMELDGVRWSLKGVNGDAVPLVGLLRNVEVEVGGHRFDHHFFVSSEGTGNQDVILGQPWLIWFSANIGYTRKGSMLVKLWKHGDSTCADHGRRKPPTIAIQLVSSDVTYGRHPVNCTTKVDDASDSEDWELGN